MFDIITIGTATLDVYLLSKCGRRAKDKYGEVLCLGLGGKHEVADMHITTGGGATNAAAAFSRQGFRTACVAKVGDDILGQLVEEDLRMEGVWPYLSAEKNNRTAYSTILLTPKGERIIFVYRGASERLTDSDIPWSELNAKWAYIASGGISYPLLQKLIKALYSRGILIALNPGRAQIELGLRRLAPIISRTKVFIVNREEASRLAGVAYGKERQVFAKLDKAVGGILAVTDAQRGVKVSDGHTIWQAGVFKERRVTDRTGAGDSFGAGFVAGLMQKNELCAKGVCNPANIAYALRLASANATSNIEAIGAKSGLLTRQQFRAKRWSALKIVVQ